MSKDEKWLLQEKYDGTPSSAFEADCLRLKSGEPLAYVIGHQPFLGLTIWLDSKPLIPRPETEWWTEEILARIDLGKKLRLLDLCAGSGAVGCAALARLPQAEVFFGELDAVHENTILKNIRENNLDQARATIRIGDLFEPFDGVRFDIIAANPPYIPSDRKLPESVSAYEPARALFGGAGGLEIIRRIASDLRSYLAPNGQAWIECDESNAQKAADLFKTFGYATEIRTDPYRRQRLIVVSFA